MGGVCLWPGLSGLCGLDALTRWHVADPAAFAQQHSVHTEATATSSHQAQEPVKARVSSHSCLTKNAALQSLHGATLPPPVLPLRLCLMPPGVDGAPLPPDAADFVSRIVLDGQTIGTIVRIKKDGLCVTAAHCLVEKGKFLEHASAFGGKLQLIGSSPFHDIIFVQGRQCWRRQLQQPCAGVGRGLNCSSTMRGIATCGRVIVLCCDVFEACMSDRPMPGGLAHALACVCCCLSLSLPCVALPHRRTRQGRAAVTAAAAGQPGGVHAGLPFGSRQGPRLQGAPHQHANCHAWPSGGHQLPNRRAGCS